ncbi:MAG: prepilin peptidase [candidate division Zixibacteria bacterium]|nr:prepilin peptidase [candidate division Zixibacteria bacterium]
METIYYVLLGLMGLCVGSFLNVVIYRLPREKTILLDRSRCPNCSKQLAWYHNIPLLSFIALRGKCAFCAQKISPRYPLIEAINAATYLFFFHQYGPTLLFFTVALLASALLVIFFIDLDFQIIPDSITIPGMILGMAVSFLPDGIGIIQSAIGLLVGGGALYCIALLGDWLFKKESMGGGDIKMAGMLGSFLGWQKVLFVFIASASIGLVVSLVIMAFSAKMRKERLIPFGPFLALAAMVAILYGDRIVGFYISTILRIP